jgi:type III restriction enzyme
MFMALHPDFPESPYAILDPLIRWFPADEALRETSMDKLMPPLVSQLRRKVKEWRDSGYVGATDTSKSLLNWWFNNVQTSRRREKCLSKEVCSLFWSPAP